MKNKVDALKSANSADIPYICMKFCKKVLHAALNNPVNLCLKLTPDGEIIKEIIVF